MLMRPSQPGNNVLRVKDSMAAAMKLYKGLAQGKGPEPKPLKNKVS
jgi:hypothetical protein